MGTLGIITSVPDDTEYGNNSRLEITPSPHGTVMGSHCGHGQHELILPLSADAQFSRSAMAGQVNLAVPSNTAPWRRRRLLLWALRLNGLIDEPYYNTCKDVRQSFVHLAPPE